MLLEKENKSQIPGNEAQDMLLDLRLPVDPKAVPEARHRAMEVCTDAGLTEDDCSELDLALGEALANAVMHGKPSPNCPTPDPYISVRIWNYHLHLIVQVHDCGPGFEPPLPPYPMPLPEEIATHGRGLPLMQTLTDALIICRDDVHDCGTSIYMIKRQD